MKKILLLGAALLGFGTANAADAVFGAPFALEEILGEKDFTWTFWDLGWYDSDTEDYTTLTSNNMWTAEIVLDEEVENGVILKNIPYLCTGIKGVADPVMGTITFPAQKIAIYYPEYDWSFETWFSLNTDEFWETGLAEDAQEPVVAVVDAEGNITFNGWTTSYIWTGEYEGYLSAYFWDVTCTLWPAAPEEEEEDIIDIDDLVGSHDFTWTFWDVWEFYGMGSDDYITFESNSEWQADIELDEEVENGIILKNIPWNCTGINGVVDTKNGTITFPAQTIGIYYPEYDETFEVWFSADTDELWETGLMDDAQEPVVATIDADGNIEFNGWTMNYIWTGNYEGYVSSYFWDCTCEIYKATSGIESVAVESANGPVEYYNLQGVRMNSENLPAGIYVKRQGNKASKVLVK